MVRSAVTSVRRREGGTQDRDRIQGRILGPAKVSFLTQPMVTKMSALQ